MNKSWTPTKIIAFFVAFFIMLATSASYVGVTHPLMYLNENQVLYLFSTSAQVLAGIYGLTLTGFVFFRNELSREEFEDDTLVDAVESLKNRYFTILIFITALSILAILLSNLAISSESNSNINLNSIIINAGQSAFITSLFVIAYFIFDVISPKRIENASKTLQNKLDPDREKEKMGNLEEFLKNYNQIENLLSRAGQNYLQIDSFTKDGRRKRISNTRFAEILFRSEKLDESLYGEIRSLITLRNAIIHGAEPVVSENLVLTSRRILQALEGTLGADAS